jgi:hypothetical protein
MRLLDSRLKRSSRPPPRRYLASPVPGARSIDPNESRREQRLTALPTCTVGAPPGRPPGATRPAPQVGGIRGVGVPPEIRRRVPGAARAASGAADLAEQERLVLREAQGKLLNARQMLESTVALLREQLAPGR